MTADRAKVSATSVTWTNAEPDTLMERVLAPANLKRAYRRVVIHDHAVLSIDEIIRTVSFEFGCIAAAATLGSRLVSLSLAKLL